MELEKLINEFTKENVVIQKINLGQDLIWKGEYLCNNKKHIVFINNNITDVDLIHILKPILDHIRHCTNSPDKFYYPFDKL